MTQPEPVKPTTLTIEQRLQAAHKKLIGEYPELEGIVTNLIWKTKTVDDKPETTPARAIVTPRSSGESDISLGFFLGLTAAGIQLIELSATTLAHAAIENKEIAKMDLDDDVEV